MDQDMKSGFAQAALGVARFVHDSEAQGIIVSGGSNQLSRSLLALAWGVLYPDTALPRAFVFDESANAVLYKREHLDASYDDIRTWMQGHAPELLAMASEQLCFVDDFSLSGHKCAELKKMFEALGFSNMSYAFFGAHEHAELPTEAFVGTRAEAVVEQLHRLSEHIRNRPEKDEQVRDELSGIESDLRRYRAQALEQLREIGQEMKHPQ